MSPRKRYRVLARDGFTCQYCGRRSPDVQLEVDHIFARAHGGGDDMENLTTACVECNRGKHADFVEDLWPFPIVTCMSCGVAGVETQRAIEHHESATFWWCPSCSAIESERARRFRDYWDSDPAFRAWIEAGNSSLDYVERSAA